MADKRKYVWAALIAAVVTHFAIIHAIPRLAMDIAFDTISAGEANTWRVADRVTPQSKEIVRPSPDFSYAACPFDLSDGPLEIRAAPWGNYWSLSLYADNSDNFFVIDDRETRYDARIVLVRAGSAAPDGAERIVESPSRRGIAIIRRLAPDVVSHAQAVEAARGDICAPFA